MRGTSGRGGINAGAVDQTDAIGREIVQSITGAFVGISDSAAVFEPPFARCADSPVDAPRAGRWGRDDAGASQIESAGYLNHQGDVFSPAAVIGVGEVFAARDLAGSRRRVHRCLLYTSFAAVSAGALPGTPPRGRVRTTCDSGNGLPVVR